MDGAQRRHPLGGSDTIGQPWLSYCTELTGRSLTGTGLAGEGLAGAGPAAGGTVGFSGWLARGTGVEAPGFGRGPNGLGMLVPRP